MEVKFEVLLSSSIKRKKPWPRFCWLGKEKEGVFLLDDNRISEINLRSGQTKKKISKIQQLLPRALTMSASQNGAWLVGILVSGEVFLWDRDKDSLKMATSVPAVYELTSAGKAVFKQLSLVVSGDGRRVLVASLTGQVFLWECLVPQDLNSFRDITVKGRWSQITPPEHSRLPSVQDKEACLQCVFVQNQVVGDVCLCAFIFTAGQQLFVTFLKIQWEESWRNSLEEFNVNWVTKSYTVSHLVPPCQPVKSRGALVPAFSPDGQLLALILNQKDPRATQALFISVQNFVTVSSSLGGCGSKKLSVPSKYVRSYWVSCASWMPGGLYLACILKRGSVLMLALFGGLVLLSTSGCDIEFGPAHFLPLHPLVMYRPPVSSQPPDDGMSSSSVSLRDPMRQRYSVTWHPRLPCLIVSDGYMVTALNMSSPPTSSSLMSSFLMETAHVLERVRRIVHSELPQMKSRLESMSTLKFPPSLTALKRREMPESTPPLVLQVCGETGGSRLTTKRIENDDDDDDDDSDEGHYAGSVMGDGGRLEFASLFDTLHAKSQVESEDSSQDSSALLAELTRAERSLLNAWALGVSLGGSMDQRERMLKYTVSCAVRLARLLSIAYPLIRPYKQDGMFEILRSLLSFVPLDSFRKSGGNCLGVILDLVRRFVNIFLPSAGRSLHAVCSSQNFMAALVVLREASKTLDQTYNLPQKAVRQANGPTDIFSFTLLQDDKDAETARSHISVLNRPSNRLVVVWRDVYRQALQYLDELRRDTSLGNQNMELEMMSKVIPQIQESLQRAGDHLEDHRALYGVTGEEHFICGEYGECVQVWREQLWEESARAGPRTVFLETRYYLAVLFGQLFQYRLREAQALCDTMARQLLSLKDTVGAAETSVDEARFEFWLPQRVNSEAAYAVVQSLGRFMATYFTNQPIAIFPPHNVDVLPPLHLPQVTGRRMVALSQGQVAAAVRSQHLSDVWTVKYALELLLLGGLIPEATWLAHSLGDWKMATSLGLAYTTYCRVHYDFSRLRWRELHLPAELQPGFIFQSQLESLLDIRVLADSKDKAVISLPATVEAEDLEVLHASAQEILKASVMAEVDVVSWPLTKLLESAKEHASSFTALVTPAFYLPAPPLYCPQPAPNTQDSVGDILLVLERESRCCVAELLQRVLLLLRAAHCSRPAVQWYVGKLHRCRKLLHKIRKGYVQPQDDFPEGLKKFINPHGFFRSRSKDVDGVVVQTIVCFRELCALCWMLHVRDQLTVFCRKYQVARNTTKDFQVINNSMCELREDVLRWACRLMPFSHFLNAEELLQDLVLSLVAELPAIPMVAETLITAFPDEEESVRVPLREKYTSLVQRLSSSTVQTSVQAPQASTMQEEEGVMMILLIQEWRRQRVREGRHLARKKIQLERHIWEREEEEEGAGDDAVSGRFSRCTSLSTSTLTDSERLSVDTQADTISELHHRSMSPKPQKTFKFKDGRKSGEVSESLPLPSVGTRLFEMEDEEYLRFLELFLSYVLEKDSLDMKESELPLLSSFSSHLHDRELHSDTFDILTTLRRQHSGRQKGVPLPVFCAGSCFRVLSEIPEPLPSSSPLSILREAQTAQGSTGAPLLHGKQPGLFSFRRQNKTPVQNFISEIPRVEHQLFKISFCPDLDLQLELDSSLETQFPQLARLLEWMLRWADRSVLLTHSSRKKTRSTVEPVVIRAKSSAPAVLTALRLLEQRYSKALLRTNLNEKLEAQATVTPVLPQDLGLKHEKESSVDTGYPSASGGTPITPADLDPLCGQTSEPCKVQEFQNELKRSHLYECEDVISDLEIKEPSGGRMNDLLTVAELNGDNSVVEILKESSAGSTISVKIRTKSRAPSPRDQPLTLEDLEHSETSDNPSESHSTDVGTLDIVEPTMSREEALNGHVLEAPEPVPQEQQQHSTMSKPQAESETVNNPQRGPNGDSLHPDPVRQLSQDELLRLVQLQQINFMSLMQAVGASFAIPRLSQFDAPAAQPPQPQTRPAAAPSSNPLSHEPKNTRLLDNPNSVPKLQSRNPRADQHLTVCSDWSQNNQDERTCYIPPSHGLLTTMHTQTPLHTPLQNLYPRKTTPIIQELKLLHLPPRQSPPTPVRQAWGPNFHKSTMYKRFDSNNRGDEPRAQPSKRSLNQLSAQIQTYMISDRWRERDKVRFPPVPNVAMTNRRLPLLRLPPDIQFRPIQLPQIPLSAPIGLHIAGNEVRGNFPKPQLLRVEPAPSRTGLRYNTPPPRPTPHLIPLEELMAWAAGSQQEASSKLQPLKADQGTQCNVTAMPSSKRLKRREDKKQEEKSVSFRPEDSIIPISQECEESKPTSDADYAIPLGSFESMLTGQRLLAEAQATSAELHVFAATCKRRPEIQDACTNTDPASSRSTTDKAVSAQLLVFPASTPIHVEAGFEAPAELSVDPFSPKEMVLEQSENSGHVAPIGHTDAHNKDPISVRDLEFSVYQGLPSSQIVIQTHSQSSSPPPSTQLLAASVVKTDTKTQEHANESQDYSATFNPPALVLSMPEPSGDPLTVKVLTEFGSQQEVIPKSRMPRHAFSRSQVSARLSEMDAQLAALQDIADHMDREFANTRLLINTIDALTPVVMASVEEEPYSRVTKEAKRLTARMNISEEEEEEEEQIECRVLTSTPDNFGPPRQRGRISTPSRNNSIHHGHVPPSEFTEPLLENSHVLTENILGLTGLSDVADILGDLVNDGVLSPSALQQSPSETRARSKLEEPQRRTMMEEERKELRTWMRRKQRERLVEYQKQREEKRQRERFPFTPPTPLNLSSRDLAINRKVKEERAKALLLEHHSQRAQDAYQLITDMLTTPLLVPAPSISTDAKISDSWLGSQTPFKASLRKSRTSQRGQVRSDSRFEETVVLQKRGVSGPPENLSSKLGLHRPVSVLPGDRLSQVTRRGMLTDPRDRTKANTAFQQLKTVRQQAASQLDDTEEQDVVSSWDVPLEIRRILDIREKGQDLTENDDDWLDALSESTGDILSKLDWAAIERMAAEDDVCS